MQGSRNARSRKCAVPRRDRPVRRETGLRQSSNGPAQALGGASRSAPHRSLGATGNRTDGDLPLTVRFRDPCIRPLCTLLFPRSSLQSR